MASLSTCHLGLWLGWQILVNLLQDGQTGPWLRACCAPVYLNLPDEFNKTTACNIVVRNIFLETQDVQHVSVLGITRKRTASVTI